MKHPGIFGAVVAVVILVPALSSCGTVESLAVSGMDLNSCLDLASEAAEANGGANSDPTLVMALTTKVTVICLSDKDYVCKGQASDGEWESGYPKVYSCMGSGGTGFDFGPSGVANSLRDVGINIPTSMG